MKIAYLFLGLLIFGVFCAAFVSADLDAQFISAYSMSDASDYNLTNNLSVTGSPTIVIGKVDNATNFTTSQYYSTPIGIVDWGKSWGITMIVMPHALPSSDSSALYSANGRAFASGRNTTSFILSSVGMQRIAGIQYITLSRLRGQVAADEINYALTLPLNQWTFLAFSYNVSNGNASIYVNGTLVKSSILSTASGTGQTATNGFFINRADDTTGNSNIGDGAIDSVRLYSFAIGGAEASSAYNNGAGNEYFGSPLQFFISAINCTSCNIPLGDVTPPYTTDDTTPTFSFTTSVNALCRIANANLNYTAMGSSRNCTSGEGGSQHICTLGIGDELIYYNQSMTIACNSVQNSTLYNDTSLQMEITSLDTNATRYILNGILDSSIGSSARTYQSQQVYLRAINNSQLLATVSVVAAYGNQRWIFNWENDTQPTLNLFNLSPAVYSLEFKNVSLTYIRSAVAAFINSTKN